MQLPNIDVLLFFGSFDPITIGHEALISSSLAFVHPKEVWLIPAAAQGWGKKLTDYAERENMITVASRVHSEWGNKVRVNSVERDHKLSGITADTLHFLLEGELKGKKLGLLMGADWILSLPTWEEWEWMLAIAPAFVAVRGSDDEASLTAKMAPKMRAKLNKSVFFLPERITSETRHVSSTKVRESVRSGELTDLVAPVVFEYVLKHNLYQS